MNIHRAIKVLNNHNVWRREKGVIPKTTMVDPTELGIAIDKVLKELNKLMIKSNDKK